MEYSQDEIKKSIIEVEKQAQYQRELSLESECPEMRERFIKGFEKKQARLVELWKMLGVAPSQIVFK